MQVKILHLIEGAKQAEGLTVLIDVFRAFTVQCYAVGNGARRIIPVGDIEKAYSLKAKNPEYVLIGEREGKRQEGFDYGNSPSDIAQVNFSGRTIVQTTSAGTQGIVNATHADEIITGCFANARAIIDYIRSRNPEKVSLVCMGLAGKKESLEDTLFAEYVRNALEGKHSDFPGIVDRLRSSESGRDFLDNKKAWKPKGDFDLCLSLDKFYFVLKARTEGDIIVLDKVIP
jgi:2-phosphosulfolactate phosphatase